MEKRPLNDANTVMDNKNYIENALKTESLDFEAIGERLTDTKTIRGLHASLGIVTEAGELADVFKKHLFYGKPVDWVNLEEEVGDLFWYLAVMANVLGKDDFMQIMQKNIDKLAKRYPNQQFTTDSAINRDVNAERAILELEMTGNPQPNPHFPEMELNVANGSKVN